MKIQSFVKSTLLFIMEKTVKSLKTSKPKDTNEGKRKKNKKKTKVKINKEKNILINEPQPGKENERLDKDIFDVLGFS